ncbi:MAG: protoporphyrinogen oxidase [Rhabdochlamydiaceae bacterium]|nr:protoporphyrinogen oxidase [Candidatus Amphrikana amoebophyrae]
MNRTIAIVGAGISGLSLQYLLKKNNPNYNVTIFEKDLQLGGVMQTHFEDEFLFESGPRTFPYSRAPDLLRLIEELNLSDQIIDSTHSAASRYICHNGKLEKLPNSLKELFTSPLMSGFGKAIMRDLFCKKGPKDETIEQFFTRHIGSKLTHQLIDPMVSGIYAGDISQLSIVSTFPYFKDMEQKKRSLILGSLFSKKKRKSKRGLFTLKGGMSTLIEALSQDLYIEGEVESISFEGGKAIVNSKGIRSSFDHLYLCVGPMVAKKLLPANCSHYFSAISSASIATVNMGYKEGDLPINGFGFLAPSKENEPFLGALIDSSIFPQQNHSKEQKRITVMVGGAKCCLANMDRSQLQAIANQCVSNYLGLPSTSYNLVNRYENALCQAGVGHAENMQQLQLHLSEFPITLHAPYLFGTSVNACVQAAYNSL